MKGFVGICGLFGFGFRLKGLKGYVPNYDPLLGSILIRLSNRSP